MITEFKNIITFSVNAIIYIKNGERKHGIIVGNAGDHLYPFISHTDLHSFLETQDLGYIKFLQEGLIEAIDIDLK